MTQDYKTKILNWLTANYSVNNGSNTPQYSAVSSRANNLLTYIQAQTTSGGFFLSTILQGTNANNQGLGFTIIAGYDDTTLKGFLIILDNDFDPVQTIKTYSSGTEFGIFDILNVGDDGNFFGIETVGAGGASPYKRFIMLNNIIAKIPSATEYTVVLRQSYNLPANIKDATGYSNLIKAPGQAKYLIVGGIYNGSFQTQPIATELQVNVGTANTWTEYRYSGTDDYAPTDCWASWDIGGNLSFKIVGFSYLSGTYYCEYEKSGSALARTQNTTALGVPNSLNAKIINSTTSYVCAGIINGIIDETNYLYKVNYSGNTLTQIYSKTGSTVDGSNTSGISLEKFNNEVFYTVIMNKDTTPTAHIRYIGRIIDTNTYEVLIGETPLELSIDLFMVQKQFNLYNFYYQFNNTVYTTVQIYNSLNYNGLPYQALNSMIPNSAILYDINDIAIFARNLYNRTINNNTTISTIQVPNNFINDITVVIQDLFSETGNVLINNAQEITKNIYEELLINFVNTIMVKNSNDPNNEIINSLGAIRFNNSISNLKDYDSSKITKYKINYGDGSSTIRNIDLSSVVWNYGTNPYAIYTFAFYVPVDITIENIQLISNDELTVYQSIDTSSLEGNKYYTINQKMEVV